MLTLLLTSLCSAQPGVAIGVGNRGSVIQVAPVGKTGDLSALAAGTELWMLTDVISPSYAQKYGALAQQFALDATLGEALTLEKRPPGEELEALGSEEEVTTYGRVRIGKVWLHELLLKEGLAWVLPAARADAALVKLEADARAAKKGLWAGEAPVEPWLWRELTLLGDAESKVVHSGWQCPHVKETQCRKCGSLRFYSLEEAAAQGFTPHEQCMTGELLRFAKASGGPPAVERFEEAPPKYPQSARRACVKDSDCALTPLTPCTCGPCGVAWRESARKEIAARMKANFSTAACGGVGCPACAGSYAGTRAVCREKQCTPAVGNAAGNAVGK